MTFQETHAICKCHTKFFKIQSKKLMSCRRRKLLSHIFWTAEAEEVEAVVRHRCSSKWVFLKV